MHYQRLLTLQQDLKRKSVFLFGPRQVGKTFYLKEHFPNSPNYNLLQASVYLRLTQHPALLREELKAAGHSKAIPIIIDEIQKLPILLDEVHDLIESENYRFILTGSSPRKIKHGSANLLGGRARTKLMFPLVSHEIPNYNLIKILNYGSIPVIYNSSEPIADLMDYVGNYLKEEIKAEGLVRKIEAFSSFLQTASLYNAELINFSNVASDVHLPQRSVVEYFKILEDTLIGHLLEPYRKTKRKKAIAAAKFYFFDIGVSNVLAGRTAIKPKTELFGKVLEHFIFCELKAYLHYHNDMRELSFWHSVDHDEVDFLIGDELAIEVKASDMVSEKHLKSMKILASEIKLKHKIVVSMDTKPRKMGDILVLPVEHFLKNLWMGKYKP